eukprot:649696-Heterocapsa_arctica.AAC.1
MGTCSDSCTLRLIMKHWQLFTRIRATCRQLSHARRDSYRHWESIRANALHDAFRRHDNQQVWQHARLLACKRMGPRGRHYNSCYSYQPTLREWLKHLSFPGAQGGSSSSLDRLDALIDGRGVLIKHFSEYEWNPNDDDYARIAENADQDWQGLQFHLRHGKMGRAAPPWSSPREIWAIALRAHAWRDLLYS